MSATSATVIDALERGEYPGQGDGGLTGGRCWPPTRRGGRCSPLRLQPRQRLLHPLQGSLPRSEHDGNFNAVGESAVGSNRDVIIGFDHLVDDIDLMGIDANTTIAATRRFTGSGRPPLTGPGEVGYFTSGGNTIIHGSNDADAASEFEIQLNGIKALTVDDFYL